MGHRVELSENQPPYEPPREYFAGKPCPYCGVTMDQLPKVDYAGVTTKRQRKHNRNRSRKATTVDHATPRSRGGLGYGLNRVIVCWQCNNDKKDRTLAEWHEHLTQVKDPRSSRVSLYMAQVARALLSD